MPIRLQLKSITEGRLSQARPTTVAVLHDATGGGAERVRGLEAAFPRVAFEIVHGDWPEARALKADALVAAVDAASPASMDLATARLRAMPETLLAIVVLRNADLDSTRRLIREGAADVLPEPVGETALALSLERLLSRRPASAQGGKGRVVAFLKAGGGVGATALAAQTAGMIATGFGEQSKVCLADLDLQFGAASFYLDVAGGTTITDCLEAGEALSDAPFARQLTAHRSGVRLLAAPNQMTPLESIAPPLVDALFEGLRRDFALTLVDLPADWTAWTSRALELADHIVLVTQLSVPHTQLVRRQLATLQMQNLGTTPLTLVCNALSGDQQTLVSVKAAERAIGRAFDVLVPEDRKLMSSAINQGLLIAEVKRKTKLENAISSLAGLVTAKAAVGHGAGV